MMTPKKANAGAYLAMAQQAKGIAPNAVDALDRKIARKLDGPKYSDAPLFAEKGAMIKGLDASKVENAIEEHLSKRKINFEELNWGMEYPKDGKQNFGIWSFDGEYTLADIKRVANALGKKYSISTKSIKGKDVYHLQHSDRKDSKIKIYTITLDLKADNKMSNGGTTTIDETGSNVPSDLVDVFNEFDEDADSYKEMERLKLKANELGYDFDYDLSGGPTEFWKLKNGGYILKQSHLSSAQYQDAKKLKGFDKKDYTWNVATKLYDKSVRKMHGGYIESMGDDFNKGLDRITMAFKEWYEGPMTELDDVMPAIEDVADYVKSRLISEISSVDIYALKSQGSFDDSDKVIARLNKNAPFRINDEQGNGWRIYFENYSQIIVYATPFFNEEPGTSIVFRDEDDEVIYEHFLPFDYKQPMLSYEDLYKYYRMIVIPWIKESMENLIVRNNLNYFLERGKSYDILDLGMNEWMPDYEFLGPPVNYNEELDYYLHNATNEGFISVVNALNMTLFAETRSESDGQVIVEGEHTKPFEGKNSVLKQLENLETGQELIITSYDSIYKEDDTYYHFQQGNATSKQINNVVDDLQDKLCQLIYGCVIDDYEGIEVDTDKILFVSNVQFENKALAFSIIEVLYDLRRGLIKPHSGKYKTGGKTGCYEQGGTIYEFSYRDEEGDEYEEVFDTLKEAKDTIKKYRKQGYNVMETWIYKDGEFKCRFEDGGKTQTMLGNKLSDKYPEFKETIKYAGDTLTLFTVFTEKNKNWDSEAQKMIDNEKRKGRRATVIHKGKNHGLYLKAQFDKGGYVVGSEVLFKSGRNNDETRGQILKVLDENQYAIASGFSQALVNKDDIIGKAPEKKWYQFEDGGNTKESWVQKSVDKMEEKGTIGLFTKKAKKAGMSTTAYAKKVLNKKNEKKYSLKTRREAQWMKNMNPELFKS